MTFEEVFSALTGQAGVIALTIFIIYSGYKRWWNWGHVTAGLEEELKLVREEHKAYVVDLKAEHERALDALLAERNEWKDVAMTGLRAAEKAVLQAEVRRGEHVSDTPTPT